MDKQTLSNYGWIVITVLVLAVMLALATPFGEFIANGFKATYTGFSHVTDKALGIVGLGGNTEDGSGETGGENTEITSNVLKFSDEGSYVMLYGENDVKKRPINFYFNEDGTLNIGIGPSMYVLGINDADRMGNQGNWEVFNFGMTVAEAVEREYGILYADMFAEGSEHLIDDTHILCYLNSGYGDGDETTYTYNEETGKVSASLDYIGSGITDFVITETEAYLIINGKKEYVEFVPDGEDFCGETFKGNTFPTYGKPDGFDVAVVDNGNTYQIMTYANVYENFVPQDIIIRTNGANITSCNKAYVDNGDGTITFKKETLIDTEIITIVTDNGSRILCSGFDLDGTALLHIDVFVSPENCSHTNTHFGNVTSSNHSLLCNDCNSIVNGRENEPHFDDNADGYCDACWKYLGGEQGGTGVCEHTNISHYASVVDGMHYPVCAGCWFALEDLSEPCADNDNNGSCDVCNYTMPNGDNGAIEEDDPYAGAGDASGSWE